MLAEQNDEGTESGRRMGLDILVACRKVAQPDTGKNETSEAGLTIEAITAQMETDREVAISYTTSLGVAQGVPQSSFPMSAVA